MTVSIRATIQRTIPADNQYQLSVEIIDAVGIELDVLVFDVENGTFSHVASVYDMETYPATLAAAVAAELAYFRDRGAEITYSNIRDATAAELVISSRLKLLAVGWNSVVSAFTGEDILDVDSTVTG